MFCVPLTLPDPAALRQDLGVALPQFAQIDWTERMGSTNAVLLEAARVSQRARPCLQGTHLQEQGRGRAGRAWQNQAGACLMFSCAFDVCLPPQQLPMLSPVAGMAACLALRALLHPAHQLDLTVKWPNDVQWRGAKLAGILVETTRAGVRAGNPQQHVVVMGMGMNLRDAATLSADLQRPVADWSGVMQADAHAAFVDAVQLVAEIAQTWQAWVERLQAQGSAGFVQQYAQVDALAGQSVRILDQGKTVLSGCASGVNDLGQLMVQVAEKQVPVTVGEVSVRAA